MEHEFWRVHKHDRVNRFIFECKRRQRSNRPTLIFTNTSRSSRFVWHLLHEHGIDGSHLCKTMTNQERSENLDRFQLGQVHFMVGTDLASRGLDTLRVTDVINFDSPHYVSDYLHRAGRTGRYGGPNRANVATFICFQPDYLMLNALERAVRFDRSAVESDQTIRRTTKRDRKTKDRSSESNRSSDSDHD